MSKPNKLSRGRSRKKATQPTTNLNDDADDFSSLSDIFEGGNEDEEPVL